MDTSDQKISENNINEPLIYKILSNENNEYNLLFYIKDNKLIIEAKIKNKYLGNHFIKEYSFDDLKKIEIFNKSENLKEMLNILKDLYKICLNFERKTIGIEKEKNFIVSIQVNLLNIKEINFELEENIKNYNIKEISNYINNIESKNIILNNNIKELKLENENLKIEIIELKTKLYSQNLFEESDIIKNNEKEILMSWIRELYFYQNIKTKLLFKASIDKEEKYFTKCLNQKYLIYFFIIKNNIRFGAYRINPITMSKKKRISKNSFLFSLNNLKKFKLKEGNVDKFKDISHNAPIFGDDDLFISENCLSDELSFSSPFIYNFTNKELIGHNSNNRTYFKIIDFEVFTLTIKFK